MLLQDQTKNWSVSTTNTHKSKKLVKGSRYWNSDNIIAENCPLTHCLNPLKGSWGLRKLVFNGPQEHTSTVKTVCYVVR